MADTKQQYLALLESHKPDFRTLLPEYLDVDRFIYNARAILNNRDLWDVTPESLYGCALEAARRGLEIGGPNKHCAVVKFGKSAILITQWQGKVFLWMKSGSIRKAFARCVYVGDQFSI